eukprot:229208_1
MESSSYSSDSITDGPDDIFTPPFVNHRTNRQFTELRNASYVESTKTKSQVASAISSFERTMIGKSSKYEEKDTRNMFYICCKLKGTFFDLIISDKLIFVEQLLYAVMVIILSFFSINFKDSYLAENQQLLSSLTTFLLALYLSLSIERWWRLRTQGVGNIWDACNSIPIRLTTSYHSFKIKNPRHYTKQLLFLNQFGKIKRYIQLSLSVVFTSNGQTGFHWDELLKRGVIKPHDIALLKEQGGTWAESIWSWVAREIETLEINGLFDIENTYKSALIDHELKQLVFNGKNGAALIVAQLGCRLPFIYVHCIAFIVKVHNIIFCLSAASWHWHGKQDLASLIITVLVTQLITVILNTIVIISQQIQNPFGNNLGAFPGIRYEAGLGHDFENMLRFNINEEKKKITEKIKLSDRSSLVENCSLIINT